MERSNHLFFLFQQDIKQRLGLYFELSDQFMNPSNGLQGSVADPAAATAWQTP